mmetsp:Transcript_18645/g.21448  ORF Transcript_18645/g.21448 Transcript_18645/m.21448 type:complete len:103 (+) Transcript_18645:1007-1315(+)
MLFANGTYPFIHPLRLTILTLPHEQQSVLFQRGDPHRGVSVLVVGGAAPQQQPEAVGVSEVVASHGPFVEEEEEGVVIDLGGGSVAGVFQRLCHVGCLAFQG